MNFRRSVSISTVFAALAAVPAVLSAGEITGRVTDGASGRALPNATVTVPGLARTVTANRSGQFRIIDVPEGDYDVVVRFVGFEDGNQRITVPATGAAQLDVGLATATTAEITIVGFRLSQAKALQAKRASNVIKDSVTADDAGKLPDQNAAEALSRVPGVSVTIDQGEGRYVTVRGIDPSLNNITIDSQSIGTPEGDTRRLALDTVPADLLSRLEVVKSVTPDLDGNAIGGSINIVTPSAFDDPDGSFFSATVDAGYYDMNGKTPYGGALSWGTLFGADERWGIVVSASYSDREYESENVQGGDPWELEPDEDGFRVPDALVLRDYTLERTRTGAVANLEFRPNEDVKLYFRNLYNIFEDREIRIQTIYDYRGGDLENQTPTSGTFTEGEGERVIKDREEEQSILSTSLGGELQRGAWTFGGSVSYGEADQDTDYDREWAFALDSEIPMTYDTSSFFFNVDGGADFADSALYEFDGLERSAQLITEELKAAQFDIRRAFEAGSRSGFIKFGAKYSDRDKESDLQSLIFDGFDGDLLLSDVDRPGKSGFDPGGGSYDFGPRVDLGAVESFFGDNEDGFEISDADTIAESFGADYTLSEEVSAGYLMATLEIGEATWTGGVRYEKTDTDYSAYDVQFVDGEVDPDVPATAGGKDYSNWLPGLQVRYALAKDLLVRAAWTNTIGRPSYEQTVPFRIFEIEEDDPDVFEGAITAGNPDLDPLESTNLDIAVEWYLQPAGIVSAGLFYKDIDNPIFTQVQVLEDVDFEGRFYSELELEQPQNANNGEILGVELNFQQQFSMLPSPFDGFGVQLNYTYSDSEADVFGRNTKVPFFLQSKHVGNAVLFYEKAGWELRLAYSYRSEYLEAVGDSAETDLYVEDYGRLDFKTSYEFSDSVTAFLQLQNLTDEPVRFFSGNSSRLAENEVYSWNALAGVTVKL